MKNSKIIIYLTLILFVLVASRRIIDLSVWNRDFYMREYDNLTVRYVRGASAPRGRILDVNGKVLVDNIGVNAVLYNRNNSNGDMTEVDIAYKLGGVVKFDDTKFTDMKLKTFFLKTHNDGNELITEEEKKLREERKLTKEDIESLKYERITEEMLNSMSEDDKNASVIYYLLSNGYSYENKYIKSGLTDQEVVLINDMKIPGVETTLTWERIYPYGETLRSLLGNISQTVPKELKDHYEEKGVSLNSTVGDRKSVV